ncbi:MAG: signal peptidase I, partial [bacterium]
AEKAWWETAPADDDAPAFAAPIEAVASVEAGIIPAVPTVEAPVEAVASAEDEDEASHELVWELPQDEEAPFDTATVPAASHEPEGVPYVEVAASVEGAAVVNTAAETSDAIDDDDPWAEFVNTPSGESTPEPPPLAASMPWRHEPVRPPNIEDMWGDIATHAEEVAAADPDQMDLAASLESQMAEEVEPAPFAWATDESETSAWQTPPRSMASSYGPEDEEDVILAAFERHANTPDGQPVARENDEVFAELLGTEAADIVAEASDDDSGKQSFIRMSGWAPQRNAAFDGGWAPEAEVEESLANRQPAFGGTDGAGFAPPPWAVEELEGDAEAFSPAKGHHKTKTWIRELVETGLLALLVFLSVRASFQNFKVEGSSMYPTLENGQFLIVNKLVYSEVDMDKLSSYVPFVDAGSDPKRQVFHGPDRGDIIVLKDPRNTDTDLIKRVIGLPGETIEIVDGKVYIDDHLLAEPYIKQVWHDTKPKIIIPPGEFFVMGDNRDNSLDSRSSQVGLVPQDLIIGKAMLSYWPRDKFGLAPNEEGTLGDAKPVLTTKRIGDD